MIPTDIKDKVWNHKGQTLRATWESTVPCLKQYAGQVQVIKRTNAHVIAGVSFANRKEVREAIELGLRGGVQPLPWGEWSDYPFLITHKGETYVRLFPPTDAQAETFNLRHESEWYVTSQDASYYPESANQMPGTRLPISQEQAMVYCGSKAAPRDDKPSCFCVKCSNVVSIG